MTAATSNRATWKAMQSYLQAMGGVANVVVGEPKSKMQSGTVAIIPLSGRIVETTLGTAREVHVVTLRRYESALQDPQDELEYRLDQFRADIEADLLGEFDLGGSIAYPVPAEWTWEYGYQTVENTLYRLLDINVAYRVDDRATFTA